MLTHQNVIKNLLSDVLSIFDIASFEAIYVYFQFVKNNNRPYDNEISYVYPLIAEPSFSITSICSYYVKDTLDPNWTINPHACVRITFVFKKPITFEARHNQGYFLYPPAFYDPPNRIAILQCPPLNSTDLQNCPVALLHGIAFQE